MSDRRESGIEAQIAAAQRRGDFDDLPGAGKPLPGAGRPLGEDWWLREKVSREKLGPEVLPTTLRLRKEIEELPDTVASKRSEAEVRRLVEDLNRRVHDARLGPVDGPAVTLETQDVEAQLEHWRRSRR